MQREIKSFPGSNCAFSKACWFQKWRRGKARSWHQKADGLTAVQRPPEDRQFSWGYLGRRIFEVFSFGFPPRFPSKVCGDISSQEWLGRKALPSAPCTTSLHSKHFSNPLIFHHGKTTAVFQLRKQNGKSSLKKKKILLVLLLRLSFLPGTNRGLWLLLSKPRWERGG